MNGRNALMNLCEPFIRRPIGTSLLALGILLLGALARAYLPVAPLPNVEFPFIFVVANEPGANPETMASTVSAPLEKRFGQIAGVNELTSQSALGSSVVIMQFDITKNVDAAARDVAAAINASSADLPAGLPLPPIYHKANPNNAPVVILALTSDNYPLSTLYNYADSLLAQRISQVEGVSEVEVVGGAQPAVHIQINTPALAAMGLNLQDVKTTLSGLSALAPKGSLSDGSELYAIAANDQLSTAADYRRLVVGNSNGVPITLAAVATVTDGQLNPYQAGWFNKKLAVLLLVRKQSDANVIKTADGVKALIPKLQGWLPPGVHFELQTDRTQTIRASVRDVQISLMLSIVLVILVMLLFLRRGIPTAIAGVTIPLSIMSTFAIMYLMHFSIDTFSLMALTMAVGFVVDDAIVVIENIVRHLEMGESPFQAALNGGREIGFTVLSMTLSLIAVFIPILFMGGVVGKLFDEFAVTLALAIAMSGVVALTLTPSLCGRFLRHEAKGSGERRQPLVFRVAERGFDGLLNLYRKGLNWSLRHTWVMLLATLLAVFLTIYLYVVVPKGFFPQQDTGMLQGATEAAETISFDAIVEKQNAAAAILLADPDVESMASFLGGNRNATNNGSLFITLRGRDHGRKASVDEIINRLRPKLAAITGLGVYLQPVQDVRTGGRPGKAQYGYTVLGANLPELYGWVTKFVERLRTVPELKDVNSDLEKSGLQMNVVVDRDAASRLGLSMADIDRALGNAFSQSEILITYTELNQYHVVLEAALDEQRNPESLRHIFINSGSGTVPLAAIARLELGTAPLSISHEGQFPVVNVTFNLAPSVALGAAAKLIDKTMSDMHPPPDIRGEFNGNAKLFVESLSTLPILILTALLTVYIVLGMLYESLIHPLTILSTLPSAGIGALVAMLVTGTDLSIVSIIGIILLIGIVKKNAIMMVDFALDAERRLGMSPHDAILEACIVRFRPIMMTTMASIFGALPLAIGMGTGSEIRQPLGISVVGGLLLSQMLTLFTTPAVYLSLERLATFTTGKSRSHRRAQRPLPA